MSMTVWLVLARIPTLAQPGAQINRKCCGEQRCKPKSDLRLRTQPLGYAGFGCGQMEPESTAFGIPSASDKTTRYSDGGLGAERGYSVLAGGGEPYGVDILSVVGN